MIKKDKTESRFRKFISGKAFYGVLAACVFTIGAVSYAAIETMNKPMTTDRYDEAPTQYIVGREDGEQAGIIVNNIPNTGAESGNAVLETEAPAEAETEPPQDEEVQSNPTAETVKPYEGFFMLPLSTSVSSDYSDGKLVYSPTMRDWRAHMGIDFAAEKTSQAVAVNDGTVLSVRDDPLWGGVIEIDHGSGMVSRYCGVNPAPAVTEGASVQMGQELGNVTTVPIESAEKLHLHFEVTVDEKNVDPLAALNKLEERD